MADTFTRIERSPTSVRFEGEQWGGSVTQYSDGKILGELGQGYGNAIGIDSIADCDAIIALTAAIKAEWARIEGKEGGA